MAKEAATRTGDSQPSFFQKHRGVKPEDNRELSAIMTTFYVIVRRNQEISTHEIAGSSPTMTR